ncbi:hypothetical protein V7S43_001959 [Phytophthora oleae]|uniref:Uncharacterized protein n=1 Tax=Phytophthora oleae TaxID=2107226 RepID=A0ABD3G6A1_9STRA
MKNDPIDDGDQPEADNNEPQLPPALAAEQDRRLTEFRVRCARMRENTERELARLAQRRADVRAEIGITSATMEQWKQEHQQMMREGMQ